MNTTKTIKKPMLASLATDFAAIKYPVLASQKLDGIRALVINGVLVSREFKPIRNKWCQKMFAGLPEGTDGELIKGDPTDPMVYRKTVKAVMAEDGEPTDVVYRVFDNFTYSGGFEKRFFEMQSLVGAMLFQGTIQNVEVVAHKLVNNQEELEAFEADCIEQGFEGAMIRSLSGPYKQGRSTEKEGYLLKIKRFIDFEARVVRLEEGNHNTNVATTSPTGRTVHSAAKAGMVPTGALGKIIVVAVNGPYEGKEFGVGTGFTQVERNDFWKSPASLVGKIVVVKAAAAQASGGYDLPRFPVYKGERDAIDMGE